MSKRVPEVPAAMWRRLSAEERRMFVWSTPSERMDMVDEFNAEPITLPAQVSK